MYHAKFKASEKLPRGTYFYITVGDRLYAGEEVVIVETPVKAPPSYLQPYGKPTGARSWRWGLGSPTRIPREHAAYYKKREGRAPPEYWMKKEKVPDPVKRAVTGTKPRLTDEFKDVKRFRRLNQAEAACERLKAMYAGLDIRVSIELHEGDR